MSIDTTGATTGREGFIDFAGAWNDSQRDTAARLPASIESENVETVRVVYSDQHGLMRGKSLSAQNFILALRNGVAETVANIGKDSANIPAFPLFDRDGGFGVDQMGGGGDMVLVPDPETFRVLPWAPDTAWVLSDLYLNDGERCPFDCRHVLRQALNTLAAAGQEFVVGLELEFYIFDVVDARLSLEESGHPPEPPTVRAISHGYQYHAEARIESGKPLADELRIMIDALGLPLRTIEAEWGPGQFEVTFNPIVGLDAADALLLFRSATKHLMQRQGRLASFMAKPALPNILSSGWHLHQSLRDPATKVNSFAASDRSALLSDTGRHYMGGLIEHAAATTIFSNPTVNGYKRLNANPLAPNHILWSHDNRGAMLRLLGGNGDPGTHIENRIGEPCANPYLYMASQIYTGLDGMQRKSDPGDPVQENPYTRTDKPPLPCSLMEAVQALDQSTTLRGAFGDQFIDYLLTVKRAEISRFLAHVTDWEHKEYFEMY